jgi:hypothetical protein
MPPRKTIGSLSGLMLTRLAGRARNTRVLNRPNTAYLSKCLEVLFPGTWMNRGKKEGALLR